MEFDFFEDGEHMRTCLNAVKLSSVISEARECIRGKIKYDDTLTDKEEKLLEEIRDVLLQVELD